MGKALYRKYRPENFNDFVGQKYVVDILKKSIEKNKVSHAYIFFGPRGSGKTSAAKIFSELINCEQNENGKKCGKCSFCISKGSENTDIIEIDAASNNGVDQIREIKNNCMLLPNYGKYKIYIVDEVHMLSINAFNALLKILEEPPKHVIFIMATTEVNKIPATVMSRSQRFDFTKIKSSEIKGRLQYVANAEKINIDDSSLEMISIYADGSLRDALSFLDQLSVNKKTTILEVNSLFGMTDENFVKELSLLIVNKNIKEFPLLLEKIKNNNINVEYLLKNLILKLESDLIKNYDDYVNLKRVNKILMQLIDIYNQVIKSSLPVLTMECLFIEKIFEDNQEQSLIIETPKIEQVELEKPQINKDIDGIINNALVYANKADKSALSALLKENELLFVKEKMAMLAGIKPFVVGKEYIVFVVKPEIMPQVNKKEKQILKFINKITSKENKIAFIEKTKSLELKEYYLKNKDKLKYVEIDNKTRIISEFQDIIEEE